MLSTTASVTLSSLPACVQIRGSSKQEWTDGMLVMRYWSPAPYVLVGIFAFVRRRTHIGDLKLVIDLVVNNPRQPFLTVSSKRASNHPLWTPFKMQYVNMPEQDVSS